MEARPPEWAEKSGGIVTLTSQRGRAYLVGMWRDGGELGGDFITGKRKSRPANEEQQQQPASRKLPGEGFRCWGNCGLFLAENEGRGLMGFRVETF